MASSILGYFKGELVTVYTDVQISGGMDEEGNPIVGGQSFQGWLIDYDKDWIAIGEYRDEEPHVHALVRRKDIVSVELRSSVADEVLLNPNESSTLN